MAEVLERRKKLDEITRRWNEQYKNALHHANLLMNELFKNIKESHIYNRKNVRYPRYKNLLIHELSWFLITHLVELRNLLLAKLPIEKTVMPDVVMAVIYRGLTVTSNSLGLRDTRHNISLRRILPDVHMSLLSLLNALIKCRPQHLLTRRHIICQLVGDTIYGTHIYAQEELEKKYVLLRVAAYNSLSNWLLAAKGDSGAERISRKLIGSFLIDMDMDLPGETPDEQIGPLKLLCSSALKTLEPYMRFMASKVTLAEQSVVHRQVIDILYAFGMGLIGVPYTSPECREKLYAVLLAVTLQSNPRLESILPYAISFLSHGKRDSCHRVSRFCTSAVNKIMELAQPQFLRDHPALQLIFMSETRGNNNQSL